MAGIVFCSAYSVVEGNIVNNLNCRNSNGSSCILSFVLRVILLVAAAELAAYIYHAIAGADASQLPASLLRGLVIGIGIFILFRRRTSAHAETDSKENEAIVAGKDDSVFNQLPNIDALTRTSNERGLTISILELMALADRYGHKLSIGMIKVDGLDTLERSAADDAMINMAGLMTESLKLPDRIGRFRDDVFMVLLPESDLEGAAIVAYRLRENLEQNKTEAYAEKVSVWIGMTEFHRGEDLQSLLDRVESAADQSRSEENGVCIKQL